MAESELAGVYRQEGDWTLVELQVRHPAQLLNSLDPSPFRARDLDAEAAEYLVDAIRELDGQRQVKIVVYLPGEALPETQVELGAAIRNFFRYREQATRADLRQVLRVGRLSLVVGLAFLSLCMALAIWLFNGDSVVQLTLHEGFVIIGWVALWRPTEILLYDWWPLWRDARLYRRISALPVEIRPAR